MDRNFKIEEIDDKFVKVFWKLKNTIDRDFVWSEIKDSVLINNLGEPIGLLKDFELNSNGDKFEQTLIFIVFPICNMNGFKDVEIMLLDNGKFEFRMI